MRVTAVPTPSQNHHESSLPSQRYKNTRLLPPTLNPIVPQDVAATNSSGAPAATDFPEGFFEQNATRARQPTLGNPIFGYSTHPIPAPVNGSPLPSGASSPTKGISASQAKERIGELQTELAMERKMRKKLEAELEAMNANLKAGKKTVPAPL